MADNQLLFFEGAFIQLDGHLEQFTPEQWHQELSYMNDLGMNLVISQFSGNAGYTFYPKNEGQDVFRTMLDTAAKLGMSVIGGLELPQGWWEPHQNFVERARTAAKDAKELWHYYGEHEAFAGWYIPHELDDHRFADDKYIPQINQFLKTIVETCKGLSEKHSVSMAPYFVKSMSPERFEEWYTKVLTGTGLDIMMLQDGVGCKRIDNKIDVPPYYEAMRNACQATGVEFWSDIEVFEQIHGMPVDEEKWAAVPAKIDLVMEQILVQSPYVTKTVIFDFSHYMSPLRSAATTKLYNDYKNVLAERGK